MKLVYTEFNGAWTCMDSDVESGPVGLGPTKDAAIQDFLEQEHGRSDESEAKRLSRGIRAHAAELGSPALRINQPARRAYSLGTGTGDGLEATKALRNLASDNLP